MDIMDIEILEDGTLAIKTDSISEANHLSADEFIADVVEAVGGERKSERREHPFMKNVEVLRGGKIVRSS